MSAGYEHLDIAECRHRNIKLGYTPDVLTEATSELCVALLLSVSRRIVEGERAVRSGEWKTWNPTWMCGRGLFGSTIGILGLGRIGMAVARRLKPFGIEQILYNDERDQPCAKEIGAGRVDFKQLLTRSDFVIATCPLTPETKEIFNASSFALMKRTSIFINIARSGIMNQDDLYDSLKSGIIGGAGLDVTTPEPLPPNHPLLDLINCVVLPHIGSATIETRSLMSHLTAKNILAGLMDQPLPSELKVGL